MIMVPLKYMVPLFIIIVKGEKTEWWGADVHICLERSEV